MLNINIYIIAISTFLFCYFRTRFLMLFFQQDEYRNLWFLKFIFKRAELIDKKLTFCLYGELFHYLYILVIVKMILLKKQKRNWLLQQE